MVLKPCARPTFFLWIIQFFIFYYFVKQEHYMASPPYYVVLEDNYNFYFLWPTFT